MHAERSIMFAEESEANTLCAMHPGIDCSRVCSRPIRTRRIALFFQKLIVDVFDGLFFMGKSVVDS